MRTEEFLKHGERLSVKAEGTTVNLRKGELLRVTVKPQNYTFDLERGDQVKLPNGEVFDSLDIVNLGRDSEIILAHLSGTFTPTIDGSKLSISADIEAEDLEVTFAGRQPVSLRDDQKVKAEILNFPQKLDVEVINPLEMPDIQKVHVVEESTPNLKWVAHETMTSTGTITGNTRRKELMLQADEGNTATIWLGGYQGKGFPILAGGGFVLSNGAEVDIYIPADCLLYVSEVTA